MSIWIYWNVLVDQVIWLNLRIWWWYLQVIFELPVKSESVLSLYRLDLDTEGRCSEPASGKDSNSRHFHKQMPGNRRILGQPPARRLAQQTPPMRRMRRQRQLPVPVLSVESLTTALRCAGISYLDNGDLCRHGSVPDLQRVFVSDYIWTIEGDDNVQLKITAFCNVMLYTLCITPNL